MHCLLPLDAYNQTTRRGFTALSTQRQIKTHSVGQLFIPEFFLKSLFPWLLHQKTSWKSSTKWVTKKGPIHCTWNVDRVEIKCKARALNLIKQLNFIYSLKLALLQQNKEKLFKKLCSCQCLVDFKQFLSIFNDNIFIKSHLYRFCYLTHSLGLANGEQFSVLFSRRWRRGKYLLARSEINGKIQIPTDFCSSSRSTFNNVTGGKTDLVVLFAANFLQPALAWWAKFLDAQWPLSLHSTPLPVHQHLGLSHHVYPLVYHKLLVHLGLTFQTPRPSTSFCISN